jgi:hypothetical protein
MKLLHVPFLLVLMGVTVYVRDILSLPFYGSRIFIVNLYLLLFGSLLYLQSKNQRRLCKQAFLNFLNISPLVVLFSYICVFLFINVILNALNNEQSYFFLFQILNFSIGTAYLYLIIFNDGLKSLLKSFSIMLWLLLIIQFLLHIVGSSLGMFGELTSNRNGIAFLSFFFYLLCCADGERKIRKELLLVILFALLNQTNSIFLLLTVHFLHYLSSKTILRFKLVRIIYIKIILLIIFFGTFFGIDLLLFYLEISESELIAMELNRYHIQDNLGSLISRLGSTSFTIEALIQGGNIFGLGPDEASKLLYWGYPVHNYFVSLIAITGVYGILFSLALYNLIYEICKLNFMLGISVFFYLSFSNDLSLFLVLCIIPLIIRSSNPSQKLSA